MRIHPVPVGLITILVIALSVLGWIVMMEEPERITVEKPVLDMQREIRRIDAGLDALSERLDRIEGREAAPIEAARRSVEPVGTLSEDMEYLRSRMDEHERELAALKLSIQQGGQDEIPAGYTADVLKKLIQDLRGTDMEWKKKRRQQRIELSERFLRDFPSDPKAGSILDSMISDCISEGRLDRARAALDELAPIVGLEAWRINNKSANLYSLQKDFDRARQMYDLNIHSSNISESERASSMFWYAYSYMQESKYKEARPLFQALIDRYGENPPNEVKDSVNGARTQLEKIEKYLNK